MSYNAFKVVHLIGVIAFLGNIIITAAWKTLADRTGDPRVIAYAQRLVTLTDWTFTAGGVVLIVLGGYGMAFTAGIDPRGQFWLVLGQALFGASGLIWVAVLIPTQIAQARGAPLRRGRHHPGKLLAACPPLDGVGRDRHAYSVGECLCHGVQAVTLVYALALTARPRPSQHVAVTSKLSCSAKAEHPVLAAVVRASVVKVYWVICRSLSLGSPKARPGGG
jgi:uncharacterized membrane protein